LRFISDETCSTFIIASVAELAVSQLYKRWHPACQLLQQMQVLLNSFTIMKWIPCLSRKIIETLTERIFLTCERTRYLAVRENLEM